MSEEAVPATEAGETPTAELAADPMFDKLAESLGSIVDPEPAAAPEEPAAEAKSEPEQTEEDDSDWDDLSDEKPWTPERHKKVAEQHQRDRRKISSMLATLGKREKKLRGKVDALRTEKQQMGLLTQRLMNDVETLRVGTADQAMAALGRLSQRDPHQMYEAISLAMLGKAPQKSAESAAMAELKAELAALREERKSERAQQTEQQQIVEAQAQAREVLQAKEEWPLLAAKASESPEQIAGEFWTIYTEQSRAAGRWLDVATVADRIERTLRRKMPSHQATNGATGSGPGRVQETRAQANPETAQSPPRSLSPSHSATSGASRREMTEAELQAELVSNAPAEFWNSLVGT